MSRTQGTKHMLNWKGPATAFSDVLEIRSRASKLAGHYLTWQTYHLTDGKDVLHVYTHIIIV